MNAKRTLLTLSIAASLVVLGVGCQRGTSGPMLEKAEPSSLIEKVGAKNDDESSDDSEDEGWTPKKIGGTGGGPSATNDPVADAGAAPSAPPPAAPTPAKKPPTPKPPPPVAGDAGPKAPPTTWVPPWTYGDAGGAPTWSPSWPFPAPSSSAPEPKPAPAPSSTPTSTMPWPFPPPAAP